MQQDSDNDGGFKYESLGATLGLDLSRGDLETIDLIVDLAGVEGSGFADPEQHAALLAFVDRVLPELAHGLDEARRERDHLKATVVSLNRLIAAAADGGSEGFALLRRLLEDQARAEEKRVERERLLGG